MYVARLSGIGNCGNLNCAGFSASTSTLIHRDICATAPHTSCTCCLESDHQAHGIGALDDKTVTEDTTRRCIACIIAATVRCARAQAPPTHTCRRLTLAADSHLPPLRRLHVPRPRCGKVVAARMRLSLYALAPYWALGAAVALLYLRDEVGRVPAFDGNAQRGALVAGLGLCAATTVAYSKITLPAAAQVHVPSVVVIAVLNGVCETALFSASLKLGVEGARRLTSRPAWWFAAGTASFFTYSGLVHALFWLNVLPPHINRSPAVKPQRAAWACGLLALSFVWAWLLFAFEAFWWVAAQHVLFDVGMMMCLRVRL